MKVRDLIRRDVVDMGAHFLYEIGQDPDPFRTTLPVENEAGEEIGLMARTPAPWAVIFLRAAGWAPVYDPSNIYLEKRVGGEVARIAIAVVPDGLTTITVRSG